MGSPTPEKNKSEMKENPAQLHDVQEPHKDITYQKEASFLSEIENSLVPVDSHWS